MIISNIYKFISKKTEQTIFICVYFDQLYSCHVAEWNH